MRVANLFGALAFMTIVLIGAYVVVDRRAADAFKAEPVLIHHNAGGAPTAIARPASKLIKQFASSEGTSESTIASSARAGTATLGTSSASSVDAEQPVHSKAHHRRRWHHRR